jgi:hypothetical protein
MIKENRPWKPANPDIGKQDFFPGLSGKAAIRIALASSLVARSERRRHFRHNCMRRLLFYVKLLRASITPPFFT